MDITRYDQKIQDLYQQQQTRLQAMDAGVLPVLRQLLKHAKRLNDDELTGYVYHSISFAEYFITGRYVAFLKYARLAARHLFRCEDRSELMHVYYLVGLEALNKGLHDIAYHLFMTARNIAEETGQKTSAAILDETIGHILIQIGDYRKARKFLKKSLGGVLKDPSHPHYYNNVTSCYMNDAEACLNLGLIEEAREDYEKTRQFMEEHPDVNQLDVQMNYALLGTKIAIDDSDPSILKVRFGELLRQFDRTAPATIYIGDLHKLVKRLIQAGEVTLAGKLVRTISTKQIAHDATEAQRIFIQTRIAYYTAARNSRKLMECYMEQDRVYARLLTEQRDSRKYTKELITLANDLQKEQEIITRRQEELIRQARIDPLTGLPNRYASNIHMDGEFENAYRDDVAFAAGILDMDGLKAHNDRYGHDAGDELIRDLAKAMEGIAEDPRIFTARYGGDEFLVVCLGMTDREIRAALSDIGKNSTASFSVGICNGIPTGKQKPWDYLAASDKALYRIKNKKSRRQKTGDISICHL